MPTQNTEEIAHFFMVGMFKFQMMICGITNNKKSDAAFIPVAYEVFILIFMHFPLTVGSQAFALGLHKKMSIIIIGMYKANWASRIVNKVQ